MSHEIFIRHYLGFTLWARFLSDAVMNRDQAPVPEINMYKQRDLVNRVIGDT